MARSTTRDPWDLADEAAAYWCGLRPTKRELDEFVITTCSLGSFDAAEALSRVAPTHADTLLYAARRVYLRRLGTPWPLPTSPWRDPETCLRFMEDVRAELLREGQRVPAPFGQAARSLAEEHGLPRRTPTPGEPRPEPNQTAA